MRRAIVIAGLLGLAAAAPADARRALEVKGPRVVEVGERVRFPTTGFKPNERIEVSLTPTVHRGGNCCGITVVDGARADANGEALLHWRWPRYYLNGGERKRWRDGSRADVIVYTRGAFGRRTVTVER